jgi:hypothetical protein
MVFIQLTSAHQGESVYVEVSKISAVYTHSDGTPTIAVGALLIPILEEPENVLAAIASEYKDYQVIGLH